MPFSFLTLMAIGYFFNDANSLSVMSIWSGFAGLVGLVSFFVLRRHKRFLDSHDEYTYESYQRWRMAVYGIAILWGSLYSSVPLLFFPNANEVEIITVVIVLILNASIPSMTKGNDPWVYILFVVPVFSCFTWQIYHLGVEQYWLLTIMVPIACASLVLFSLMTHKDQMEHTALRILYKESELKAVKANLEKTRFLAAASHDLRQPMQATSLYLGAIQPGQVKGDGQILVNKAKQAAISGNRLLDKLLDISALDGNGVRPNIQALSVLPILQNLADDYALLAQSKGLLFDVDKVDVRACFDEEFLTEILQNLLSNAFKFTEQGCIKVRCDVQENELNIHVQDTGIGMSKVSQIHIFDEFYQVQQDGAQQEIGMGLGLSIVKRLCVLQNLEIRLESTVGKGTTFTLTLPLAP
ncbi:sensor histidine kinase [Maribrevibacterium harenarium]|nr:HAMP domain-containing sensor histidine kinase [Maribrevibacterium harenarium]